MWKIYITGNYLTIESFTGNTENKSMRRLRSLVEVRQQSKNSTTYEFGDRYSIYFTGVYTDFRDINGDPFVNQAHFESFIDSITGEEATVLNPVLDASSGFVEIGVDDTEKNLTLAMPTGTTKAVIMCEADNGATNPQKAVRYTLNDFSPTAAEGFFLGEGDVLEVSLLELGYFSFTAATNGEPATLWVQFYK